MHATEDIELTFGSILSWKYLKLSKSCSLRYTACSAYIPAVLKMVCHIQRSPWTLIPNVEANTQLSHPRLTGYFACSVEANGRIHILHLHGNWL